jgi:hypothetical protein
VIFYSKTAYAQSNVSGWSKPIDITQGITSNWRAYGVPVCDHYQNLHIFWADNSDNGAAIYYRNDIEGFWSAPTDILALPYPNAHYLAVAVSNKSDTIHLAWVDVFPGNLYYSQAPINTANESKAWLPPQNLGGHVFNPALAVDPTGVIHLVYAVSDSEGINYTVDHISSKDNGKSWSDPNIAFTTTFQQPSYIRTEMAIDEDGRIHVGLTLRSQEYGAYSEVGYIRSIDGGQTWSDYKLIDNTSMTFQGVEWIAPYTFGKNEVHLTWHDPRRMHQWSFDGGDTWSNPIEIMPLGGAFGGADQLVKDSAGTLYAITAVSNGVFSAAWNGINWGPPEQIDDRDIDPHGQHIVVCQGNQLHVTYYDRTGDTTVWYAMRVVNSPHIDREPLPTPIPSSRPPTVNPNESMTTKITPIVNSSTIGSSTQFAAGNQPSSPLTLVMVGVMPAIILVTGVFLFSLIRLRR